MPTLLWLCTPLCANQGGVQSYDPRNNPWYILAVNPAIGLSNHTSSYRKLHMPYRLPLEDYEAHLVTLGELTHKYLIVFKNAITQNP